MDDLFWENPENQKEFCDWLAQELNYKKWTDWYDVKIHDFKNAYVYLAFRRIHIFSGGGVLLDKVPSIPILLATLYPQNPWDIFQFANVPLFLHFHI